MSAGDPQRTWFSEMVVELRSRWRAGLSLSELIHLRDHLDAMLHRIRSERNIRTPIIKCPSCGHLGPAMEPDVSVRATILALGRYGLATAEDVKALEKRWVAHRKANALDLHGKPSVPANAPGETCTH
jgi:hypothetical protein